MGSSGADWTTITQWLGVAWQWTAQIVSSHFFESGLVALLGAFFGAKIAQGTAARNKFRDDLTKEIRDTNAAIALSSAICNSVLNLKRQHLLSRKTSFDKQKTDFLDFERKRATGEAQGNKPYELRVDFRFLPVLKMPTDKLQAHVLDRLSVIGRPLNLAVQIAEASVALNDATEDLNDQIKGFQAEKGPRDQTFLALYFGLPSGNGEVDEIYATTLSAMALQSDCLIYFTDLLCSDLKEHGDELLSVYKKRLGGKSVLAITSANFASSKADKLFPPENDFSSWHTAFVKRQKPISFLARAKRFLRVKRVSASS